MNAWLEYLYERMQLATRSMSHTDWELVVRPMETGHPEFCIRLWVNNDKRWQTSFTGYALASLGDDYRPYIDRAVEEMKKVMR